MKTYFLKLYQYNEWSNRRVLSRIEAQNVTDEKILQVMGHIVVALFLWLHRIKGLPAPDMNLWGTYTLPELVKLSDDASRQWIDFIEKTENFNRELSYTNFVGDPYTNNVETIMIHLVNHSSYHRGQIAMLLRQKGFEPINTDLITYDRVLRGQWKE